MHSQAYFPSITISHQTYYLWKTSDPRYSKTITSASYLGFVFSGSNNANVTIKVPFMLLNLTLETAASGLGSNVQYFPVQPDRLKFKLLVFRSRIPSGHFLGGDLRQHNENRGDHPCTSAGTWSKQAGFGVITCKISQNWLRLSISIRVTTSSTNLGLEYGRRFHSQTHSRSTTRSRETRIIRAAGGGLSGGAIAGIAVGGFVILACAAFLIFLVLKRRRQSRARAPQEPRHELGGYRVGSVHRKEMPGSDPARELPPQNRFEMYGGSPAAAHELPHWGQYPKPDEQQRWSQLPASPSER